MIITIAFLNLLNFVLLRMQGTTLCRARRMVHQNSSVHKGKEGRNMHYYPERGLSFMGLYHSNRILPINPEKFFEGYTHEFGKTSEKHTRKSGNTEMVPH